MSFSFSDFFTAAENAFAVIVNDAAPVVQLAESAAPVIATLIPSTAPVISAVEAGVASITKIAPTAVSDAQSAIAAGRKILADGSPVVAELESIFGFLFHSEPTSTVIVVAPKTAAASVPVAPPGPALN